jgi:chromate transporter
VTFIPCFLWIFLGAPYVERLRHKAGLSSALAAVTAAVVGVILNLAVWFAVHTLFERVQPVRSGPLHFDAPVFASINPAAAEAARTSMELIRKRRINSMLVLAASAAAGVVLGLVGIA